MKVPHICTVGYASALIHYYATNQEKESCKYNSLLIGIHPCGLSKKKYNITMHVTT